MAYIERLVNREKSHIEQITELDALFAADRPLMAKSNSDVLSVVNLLHGEIFELNGKTEDGMSLEDYRCQEISDIQYFALTLAKSVKYSIRQLELDRFLRKQSLVMPKKSRLEVGYEYESKYTELKMLLRETADKLYASPTQESVISHAEVGVLAQEIMNIAYALHALLGRNSTEEMKDKGARNRLKHTIPGYDNPDGDYNAVVKQKGIAWKEDAKRPGGGNKGFFDRKLGVATEHVADLSNLEPLTWNSLDVPSLGEAFFTQAALGAQQSFITEQVTQPVLR